jgi:hypothetical protein
MRNAAAATIGAGDQRSRVINAVIGWRKAAGAHKAHTAGISTGLAQHSASSQSQLSRFSRARKPKKSVQEKRPPKAAAAQLAPDRRVVWGNRWGI